MRLPGRALSGRLRAGSWPIAGLCDVIIVMAGFDGTMSICDIAISLGCSGIGLMVRDDIKSSAEIISI